ncbi:aKG-HExxH-type peptide beta-hydroxylase [Streptomyces sp. NPDC004629]|uniref:aKG-HExxH-type peptide beta-hydroxylase n=1 Tax=Streptomyces sp. NPDC004629 TaxID=3364705 RepID=UPI0036A9F2ED
MAPRHHRLSPTCSTALSSAGDSASAAAELLAAEYSRRLLLLRILLERGGPAADAAGRLPAAGSAWDLLARAQRTDPDRVRRVILDPQTGIWVADALRALPAAGPQAAGHTAAGHTAAGHTTAGHTTAGQTPTGQTTAGHTTAGQTATEQTTAGQSATRQTAAGRTAGGGPRTAPERQQSAGRAPYWAEFGGLHRLAAAAASLAGLTFRIEVPVEDGSVLLPGLGRADVPHGDTAEVRGGPAGMRIGDVRVPRDPAASAPGWSGLRRLRAECDGQLLDVALDDLGRPPVGGHAQRPTRLTDAEYEGWRRRTRRAWAILVRDRPDSAAALSAGLLSLVPLPHGERLRPHSASSSDAFGCVVLSAPHPDDEPGAATELAVTLLHEYRHSALNGLMRLAPLHDGTDDGLYHAPWRDDPRPLVGLLHGAYAFAGVTAFWRARRLAETGPAALLAHFEFALWRRQTWAVLAALGERPALTAAGRHLVEGLRAALAPWRDEPVPQPAARLADLSAAHHRGAWRAHHVRPDKEAVRAAAATLATGGALPDGDAPDGMVEPDPQGCRLDVLALLARLRLADPAAFARLHDGADTLTGAAPADLALVAGDAERAHALYAAGLDRPANWAGLALALRERGTPPGRLLVDRPEFVRALAGEPDARIGVAGLVRG